jgi:hypothetical protein
MHPTAIRSSLAASDPVSPIWWFRQRCVSRLAPTGSAAGWHPPCLLRNRVPSCPIAIIWNTLDPAHVTRLGVPRRAARRKKTVSGSRPILRSAQVCSLDSGLQQAISRPAGYSSLNLSGRGRAASRGRDRSPVLRVLPLHRTSAPRVLCCRRGHRGSHRRSGARGRAHAHVRKPGLTARNPLNALAKVVSHGLVIMSSHAGVV